MAVCHIYLLTYRRNHLLSRALDSLVRQTFKDWVCDVHNDDPNDTFPALLVKDINDGRISVINHPKNLGATRSFNLVFKKTEEPFISILEDDNWWEPDFLAKMLEAMLKFPQASIAWSNMRIWKEERNGSWTNLEKNVWGPSEGYEPKLIYWPDKKQITGALHSNGAMLLRSNNIRDYFIPNETPFVAMEAIRERTYSFPILFLPTPLANFSLTLQTTRGKDRIVWEQMQVLLAASFIKNVPISDGTMAAIWRDRRRSVRSTNTLIFAGLILRECHKILKYSSLKDWAFLILFCLKHPHVLWRVLNSISQNRCIWKFLNERSLIRVAEARSYGFLRL